MTSTNKTVFLFHKLSRLGINQVMYFKCPCLHSEELMSSTPGVQTERQNGQHPDLQAQARLSPDASESSSKPKGKARKDSGQEVSSEALEDRGPNNRGEDISEPKVQVKFSLRDLKK